MNGSSDWIHLRDGATLHASQLLALADSARVQAGRAAASVGAAGTFFSPMNPPAAVVNRIEFDVDARCMDVENLFVLTQGGLCVELPPPKKSFAVPPGGDERFLNLYARSYREGGGKSEPVWEGAPKSGENVVCLAEWTGERFVLFPEPASIGALNSLREAFAEAYGNARNLSDVLLGCDVVALGRLGISPGVEGSVSGLALALRRFLYVGPGTPYAVAAPTFYELGSELASWLAFASARRGAGTGASLQPDLFSRLRLLARPGAPVPEYAKGLTKKPFGGSEITEYVESLSRALVGLARVVLGESDTETLKPLEEFEPELYPDGLGLRYLLPPSMNSALNCRISAEYAPQLLWGVGPADTMPFLRPAVVSRTEPGVFEATLGPIPGGSAQHLVVVIEQRSVSIQISLDP